MDQFHVAPRKSPGENAQYVGYATLNKDAMTYLPEDITSDESFYPSEAMEKMEFTNWNKPIIAYNDTQKPKSLETKKKSWDTLNFFV